MSGEIIVIDNASSDGSQALTDALAVRRVDDPALHEDIVMRRIEGKMYPCIAEAQHERSINWSTT